MAVSTVRLVVLLATAGMVAGGEVPSYLFVSAVRERTVALVALGAMQGAAECPVTLATYPDILRM